MDPFDSCMIVKQRKTKYTLFFLNCGQWCLFIYLFFTKLCVHKIVILIYTSCNNQTEPVLTSPQKKQQTKKLQRNKNGQIVKLAKLLLLF